MSSRPALRDRFGGVGGCDGNGGNSGGTDGCDGRRTDEYS